MKTKKVKKIKHKTRLHKYLFIAALAVTALYALSIIGQKTIFNNFAQSVGTQYYVDSISGSDANNGISANTPWKTINKVSATNFLPGDTVNFKKNSVWNQTLTINSNGTQNNMIKYQAYGTGTNPTIDFPSGNGITINGTWNKVSSFIIKNVDHYGVYSSGQHNEINGNEFASVGTGVWINADNTVVSHNNAHNLKMIKNTPGGDDDYGATGYVIDANNVEIAYNTCVDCKAQSYDYGTDGGFVEVWQKANNAYIHNNHAIRTDGFFELGGDNSGTANNVRVTYNLVEEAGSSLCPHASGTFAIPVSNLNILNNTFINSNGNICDVTSGLKVANNIFYGAYKDNGNGYTHTNNIYSVTPSFSLGSGEKVIDPKFVNLNAGDYHLQSGSAGIDAGANLGLSLDYEDKVVPVGNGPDIGAFEFGSQSLTPTLPPSATPPSGITPTFVCAGGVNCVPSVTPTVPVGPSPSLQPTTPEPTTAVTATTQPQITVIPTQKPTPGGNQGFSNFLALIIQFILQLLAMLFGNHR